MDDRKAKLIIACLRDYTDLNEVLKRASKLAGTKIGISGDFSDSIRKARDKLRPARRQAKQDKKKTIVLFPAKLVVDGVVVQDVPDT